MPRKFQSYNSYFPKGAGAHVFEILLIFHLLTQGRYRTLVSQMHNWLTRSEDGSWGHEPSGWSIHESPSRGVESPWDAAPVDDDEYLFSY